MAASQPIFQWVFEPNPPGRPPRRSASPSPPRGSPEAASRRNCHGPTAPKQDGRPPRAPRREAAPPAEAAPGCPHLAWPLSSRPTAGLTPPRAGPQPARFRRRRSGRSLSPAPPAWPLRSPPPVPRPRRRQEPGCGAGRRRGERRGWIQHGGAEPEPGVRRPSGRNGEGARAGRAGPGGAEKGWGKESEGGGGDVRPGAWREVTPRPGGGGARPRGVRGVGGAGARRGARGAGGRAERGAAPPSAGWGRREAGRGAKEGCCVWSEGGRDSCEGCSETWEREDQT